HKIFLIIPGSRDTDSPGQTEHSHILAVLLLRILNGHIPVCAVRLIPIGKNTASYSDNRSGYILLLFQIISDHVTAYSFPHGSKIQGTSLFHGNPSVLIFYINITISNMSKGLVYFVFFRHYRIFTLNIPEPGQISDGRSKGPAASLRQIQRHLRPVVKIFA